MSDTILVTYATRAGSTTEVAHRIGATLATKGATVDVRPVKDVAGLDGYTGVVMGSGIHAGRLYSDIVRFALTHGTALTALPTAAFVVCLTMSGDTPENRAKVTGWLDPLRAVTPLVDTGLFAGVMDSAKLGFIPRFVVRHMVKAPEGDFRDWAAIDAWAHGLEEKLSG